MDLIKSIISQHGSMDEAQLAQLAIQFPNCGVVVKMGVCPRFRAKASEAKLRIDSRVKLCPDDYVREVFLSSDDFSALASVLNPKNS